MSVIENDAYLLGIADGSDRERILLQNRGRRTEAGQDYGNAAWGNRHLDYMLFLKSNGINPTNIAEIGVADDARLVENEFSVFPNAHITVFEIDNTRLDAARTTLVALFGEEAVSARISFVAGDAAETLPQQGKQFELIDYQLLDQHLTDAQLKGIIDAATKTLAPNGILATADLDFDSWYTRPSRLEYADLAREANKAIQDARKVVYAATGRHDWASARVHAEAIQRLSSERLKYDPLLSRPPHMVEFSGSEIEVDLMQNITNIFGRVSPDLQAPLSMYIQALRDGKIIGSYPALFHQAFHLAG